MTGLWEPRKTVTTVNSNGNSTGIGRHDKELKQAEGINIQVRMREKKGGTLGTAHRLTESHNETWGS